MIVTFCGHARFYKDEEYEHKVLVLLEKKVGDKKTEFFLGGYGGFDSFAYYCCKQYQATHPNVSLVFISPYLSIVYQKNTLEYKKYSYDEIIYPEIEDKPPKFAIIYRNKWMVEKADFVIACVEHDWGGAYQTYKYAKKKDKGILTLPSLIKKASIYLPSVKYDRLACCFLYCKGGIPYVFLKHLPK